MLIFIGAMLMLLGMGTFIYYLIRIFRAMFFYLGNIEQLLMKIHGLLVRKHSTKERQDADI